MSDDKNTENRLASLERFAKAVMIRQIGEDELAVGVGRLTNETNALNAVLVKVDEQQKYLSSLDRRTELVEETAVSRDELISANDHQEQEAFEFRKKILKRIYLTGLLLASSLIVGVVTFNEVQKRGNEARYQACLDRNDQSDILYDILVGLFKDTPPESMDKEDVAFVREGIRRLEDKVVDCEVFLQ